MICRQCLARLSHNASRSQLPSQTAYRAFSASSTRHSTPVSIQATTLDPRPHGHPAAISTSAAQPFSAGQSTVVPEAHSRVREPSSVPPGTVLKGINYMKTQQDPIALEDHEYPDWLWTVLDKRDAATDDGAQGDIFSKSKKQRRAAAKALRKRQLSDPESLMPKIPLHEQTIDLPAGDGTMEGAQEALDARKALTKAMREARRAKIKESNFLKSMG